MKYSRIIAAVANEPWAIDREKAKAIVSLLAAQASGQKFSAEEKARRIGAREARNIRQKSGGVAVIPLHGIMAQRLSLMDEISSGGASSDKVRAQINEAAADDSVKAIILHVDSPGGSIYGTAELAAAIRAARDIKPVIAQIDSQGNSAAYWAASQATEVVITPGGDAGSVGVFTVHQNLAEALKMEGVEPTIVFAGENKVELNPFEPLSESARDYLQDRVDKAYADFVSAVAEGRGISTEEVEDKYGQGRALKAKDALKAGLVDRIATFDQTMERYVSKPTANRGQQALANSNYAGAIQ